MDTKNLTNVLNDLIKTSKDGEYGFKTCAEHAASNHVKQLLSQRESECRQAAEELKTLVLQNGGEPDDSGSLSGAMHRGWVSVRGALKAASDASMLDECERGEDMALARYREALQESEFHSWPASVRVVLERQFEGIQRNHAQIKTLRDTAGATTTTTTTPR
jgi:uncharacterized protein (TIGR02284 family)